MKMIQKQEKGRPPPPPQLLLFIVGHLRSFSDVDFINNLESLVEHEIHSKYAIIKLWYSWQGHQKYKTFIMIQMNKVQVWQFNGECTYFLQESLQVPSSLQWGLSVEDKLLLLKRFGGLASRKSLEWNSSRISKRMVTDNSWRFYTTYQSRVKIRLIPRRIKKNQDTVHVYKLWKGSNYHVSISYFYQI